VHAFTQARSNLKSGAAVKFSTVKQTTLHLVIALCLAVSVRADQTVQSVQQTLKDQGFYYGNVTGEKSAETTAAIRRYQIRNGLQVTGEINPETMQSLKSGPNSSLASSSQPASKPVVTQSNRARADENAQAGQNSLPQLPTEPDRQLDINSVYSGARNPPMPIRPNRRILAEIQYQLLSRGYYQGSIDGRYGRRTAFAIRTFQSAAGLPPTGQLDTSTLSALALPDRNLTYSEPLSRLYEMWIPITKFKHGKWKVKWKKHHRDEGDEYGDENEDGNGDGRWHGDDHED
jgi:peptidoglycan hydrolase-like protein with peptidoglycan-binding domain